MSSDDDNPAVTALTAIPPAVLEEFRDNPDAAAPYARIMYGTGVVAMNDLMRDPKVPLRTRLDWLDHLARIGNIEKKQSATATQNGPGFSVNIVLNSPQPGATLPAATAQVVDVKATEIPNDD